MYAETVMKDRGRGGNIKNPSHINPSSNYTLSNYEPVRDIYRHKSSDDEHESIRIGRSRRRKMKDKEVTVTDKKTTASRDKETQTDYSKLEVAGFDSQVGHILPKSHFQ